VLQRAVLAGVTQGLKRMCSADIVQQPIFSYARTGVLGLVLPLQVPAEHNGFAYVYEGAGTLCGQPTTMQAVSQYPMPLQCRTTPSIPNSCMSATAGLQHLACKHVLLWHTRIGDR
jgi:hypothetical protein